MPNSLTALCLAFLLCFGGLADAQTIGAPPLVLAYWQIKPQYIPSSAADLVATDTYVCHMDVMNATGSDVTITINDKQVTPIALYSGIVPAGKFAVLLDIPNESGRCRWMPGGIRWSATSANAVSVFMSGGQ